MEDAINDLRALNKKTNPQTLTDAYKLFKQQFVIKKGEFQTFWVETSGKVSTNATIPIKANIQRRYKKSSECCQTMAFASNDNDTTNIAQSTHVFHVEHSNDPYHFQYVDEGLL
jgi:hypothetical protein